MDIAAVDVAVTGTPARDNDQVRTGTLPIRLVDTSMIATATPILTVPFMPSEILVHVLGNAGIIHAMSKIDQD